jgi:Domain of unknown function (DUF4157)
MPETTFASGVKASSTASRAVASPVQAKLSVSSANDSYEQEADRVADKVVNKPAASSRAAISQPASQSQAVAPSISRLVNRRAQTKLQREADKEKPQTKLQRQEDKEEPQAKLQRQEDKEKPQTKLQRQEDKEEPQAKLQRQEDKEKPQTKLQRQEDKEEPQAKLQRQEDKEKPQTKLQRQEDKEEARANSRDKKLYPELNQVEQKLFDNKGRGEKLDDETRIEMEASFDANFSGVKVHTGDDAVAMNRSLKAQAFTHGKDIFFNSGKYDPASISGKTLLAHELTHVVQQGAVDQKVSSEKVSQNNASRNKPIPDPTDKQSTQKAQETEKKIQAQEPVLGEKTQITAQALPEAKAEAGSEPGNGKEDAQAKDKEGDVDEVPKEKKSKAKSGKAKSKAKKGKASGGKKGGGIGDFLRNVTRAAFTAKKAKVSQLATNEKKKDPAEAKLAQSEKSVVPPAQESQSRASADQVEIVDKVEQPKPDEAKAKEGLNTAMEKAVPKSIEEADEFKEKGKGRVVGLAVKEVVTADAQEVKSTYQEIENTPAPAPAEKAQELPEMEEAPETEALDMGDGMVGAVKEEHTDMTEFDKGSDDLMEKEGIKDEYLDMVDEGDLAEASKDRKQVKKTVKEGPKEVKALEQEQKQKVNQDLKKEEQAGRVQMRDQRKKQLTGAKDDQKKTRSKIEEKRQKVTDNINGIYAKANTTVKQKLDDLEKKSLKDFDKGQATSTTNFENNVNRRIEAFKSRRYDRFGGSLLWAKDKLFGMDDLPEVKNIFDTEKASFITAIDSLIATITKENQRVIQECKDIVANARVDIKKYVDGLGPELQKTGQSALKEMKGKLDALDKVVNDKEKELKKKLAEKREAAIKAIEEKIEKMKEAMSGLVSKLGNLLLNAMIKFFKWALKKAGMDSGQLMGIINKGKAVIKKIVTDPVGFIKNIITAVKNGIGLFVTNIKKHLIGGLITWLTGAMADVPITLPEKFDLKGILNLVLQILGLTWTNIRTKLVKRLGEKVVSMAEKTVDIVKRVIKEGPMALWDMIKEKAGEIKQQVMDGIRNWVITQVVKQAVIKLLSFLNPAGAIIQAIIAIYNTVMFFVENIDRIVQFVKTVFSSIADIAMGKLSAASKAVENALAMTIPIILNFLARLLGLSGIGKAVSNIIKKIRKPIDKIVNKVIDKVVNMAKKLFKKGKAAGKKVVKKVISFVLPKHRFKAGDENHTISVKKKGNKKVLYMSSAPKPMEVFLKQYEAKNKDSLSAQKKSDIAAAKNFIKSDINPLLIKLGKLKETAVNKKKITNLNRSILQKEVALSEMVRKILGSTGKLKGTVEKYKLEGLTGTYGSMPKPPYDDLTADHQPQAAILVAAKNLTYFANDPKGANMIARGANRANAGYAINLQSKRHMAGRTYGGKGTATKNSFLEKARIAAEKVNTPQKKRNVVVNLIKKDLAKDVAAMRIVVSNKANWKDITNLSISKKEKTKLINDTRNQILSGENRVAAQDLDSLKG